MFGSEAVAASPSPNIIPELTHHPDRALTPILCLPTAHPDHSAYLPVILSEAKNPSISLQDAGVPHLRCGFIAAKVGHSSEA